MTTGAENLWVPSRRSNEPMKFKRSWSPPHWAKKGQFKYLQRRFTFLLGRRLDYAICNHILGPDSKAQQPVSLGPKIMNLKVHEYEAPSSKSNGFMNFKTSGGPKNSEDMSSESQFWEIWGPESCETYSDFSSEFRPHRRCKGCDHPGGIVN